jgi:hypothetical protein
MLKKIAIMLTVALFSAVGYAQEDSSLSVSFGTLELQSDHPAGVWLNGQAVGVAPFSIDIPEGWAIYSVRSPGYWTESFIVDIKQEAKISQQIQLKKYGMPAGQMPDISNINDLKALENLYDSLSRTEPNSTPDSLCLAYFAADFPLPVDVPSPLTESSAEYRRYYEIYTQERQLSFSEFYASCSSPTQQNLKMVLNRMNVLGNKQLNGVVPIVAAKFEPSSSDSLKGNLEIYFLSPDSRADVAWKGIWESDFLTGNALAVALTVSEPVALAFLTTQNKTVWIPVENGYSRHFYNYSELNISWKGLLIPLKGKFFLPDYIMAHAPALPIDSVPLDTLPKDTSIKDIDLRKFLTLAKIPGGRIKHKNKDVLVKPFAMNTTAINQGLYNEKCGKKQFNKYKGDTLPAHSVNWKEAANCCAALGGDLPTETEWEYAARAGAANKRGLAVNANIKEYAVFNGKKLAPVASKRPNGWGLYDMLGNVAEWIKDDGFWYGKYKFLKGGSWKSSEKDLNVENAEEEDARYWGTHVGFRCVFR